MRDFKGSDSEAGRRGGLVLIVLCGENGIGDRAPRHGIIVMTTNGVVTTTTEDHKWLNL